MGGYIVPNMTKHKFDSEAVEKFANVSDTVEGRGMDGNLIEIEFEPAVPSGKRHESALGYNAETDTYDEGIIRFGEIEIPDHLSSKIAQEDLDEIANIIGRPTGELEIDLGHFTSQAPHVRVGSPVDADEMNEFMADLTTAIVDWFYPYDADEAPKDCVDELEWA